MALCQTKATSTSPIHGSVSNRDHAAEAIAGSAISPPGIRAPLFVKCAFRPNPNGVPHPLDDRRLAGIVNTMARMSTKPRIKMNNLRVFEDARELIIKLDALSRHLTPAELETLAILFDKHATALIAKSLGEAEQRDLQPIATIR
jgi:hypothetical protein